MDETLRKHCDHMLDFSVGLLGHALWHVIMTGRGGTPWSEPFGLIHVAHGGELLLKAAIAKEHPLLIFDKAPSYSQYKNQVLSFEALIKSGKTVNYMELPNLLWATTGYVLPDIETYRVVGELRNAVQHFAVPNENYLCHVLSYLCKVADPVLQQFWSKGVFAAIVEGWGEQDSYLFDEEPWVRDALQSCGIDYSGWIPVPDGAT